MTIWIKKIICFSLLFFAALMTTLNWSCNGSSPTSTNNGPTNTQTVTNSATVTNTQTVTNTATPPGPVPNTIPNQTASASGSPLHVTLGATDSLGNPVTFSTSAGTGLSVSSNVLTANVSSYTVGTVFLVTITATDTVTHETGTTSFYITVTA